MYRKLSNKSKWNPSMKLFLILITFAKVECNTIICYLKISELSYHQNTVHFHLKSCFAHPFFFNQPYRVLSKTSYDLTTIQVTLKESSKDSHTILFRILNQLVKQTTQRGNSPPTDIFSISSRTEPTMLDTYAIWIT